MTNSKTLLWLGKTSGKYKGIIGILMLLHIMVSGAGVCYALVMKDMIDNAVAHNQEDFWSGLLCFAALIVLQIVLRTILRYLEEYTRSGLENTFKERLLQNLLTKDYRQVMGTHSEEWMNRMTSDTAVCANALTEILPGFLGMAVKLCGVLLVLFIMLPKLAYIVIPAGLVFVLITAVFRKHLKQLHKRVQEQDGAFRVYVQERISSMLVLRTFGAEGVTQKAAGERMAKHRRMRMCKNRISNLCNTGFSVAMNGMYLIGISYCCYGILMDFISYGTLPAIMQLIGQLQAPLAGISGYLPKYYAMLASAERLMEAEAFQDCGLSEVKSSQEVRRLYAESFCGLELEQVSFAYEPQLPVLQDLCITLKKKEYLAITGVSGCGKSTILKLLMGIYEPDCGSVHIVTDKKQRLNIRQWRRLFSYVPQGNILMSGTIRDIVTFGVQEEAKTMTIERALQLACADFVTELPEGLETVLGERGTGLSEGQMQRIAIARALYADTPILILDEATSALDEITESRILKQLMQLTDKTVIIVTHRPAALEICNKHIYLD